jgi:hypothetical protein
VRIAMLGYKPVEIPKCYLESIPHKDGLRFKEYPHARYNGYEAMGQRTSAVVNYGRVGVGDVSRNDGLKLRLGPIPTRIFGIGMHKTATTSLHFALKLLGYESVHWGSDGWARDVWNEMHAEGFSPSIERFYAASDLPISILYRELDEAYPGSKFILTLRDEADWLKSVNDHFSERNPFKSDWRRYPISNKLHKEIYGRTDFNATVFRARYRQHNREVIEYFRARPGDLLVMQRHNWQDLCWFLDKPVPKVSYPFKFKTVRGWE